MTTAATRTDIARLRRELRERYDAYDRQQALLQLRLDEIFAIGRTAGQSVYADLGELIGRLGDIRASMDTATYARETQVLGVVEGALRGIRERTRS